MATQKTMQASLRPTLSRLAVADGKRADALSADVLSIQAVHSF